MFATQPQDQIRVYAINETATPEICSLKSDNTFNLNVKLQHQPLSPPIPFKCGRLNGDGAGSTCHFTISNSNIWHPIGLFSIQFVRKPKTVTDSSTSTVVPHTKKPTSILDNEIVNYTFEMTSEVMIQRPGHNENTIDLFVTTLKPIFAAPTPSDLKVCFDHPDTMYCSEPSSPISASQSNTKGNVSGFSFKVQVPPHIQDKNVAYTSWVYCGRKTVSDGNLHLVFTEQCQLAKEFIWSFSGRLEIVCFL